MFIYTYIHTHIHMYIYIAHKYPHTRNHRAHCSLFRHCARLLDELRRGNLTVWCARLDIRTPCCSCACEVWRGGFGVSLMCTHRYSHSLLLMSGWVCVSVIFVCCVCVKCLLQHTAIHCNILQDTAPYCSTLQHTAPHCTTLHHTVPHCITLHHTAPHCNTLHHTAPHCTTLHHTATHCNTLQHTATHGNTTQHTTHGNTTQHTATHLNRSTQRWLLRSLKCLFSCSRAFVAACTACCALPNHTPSMCMCVREREKERKKER